MSGGGFRLGGVLLAAGRARRFGSDKLRALLPDGRPVGVVSAIALADVVDELVVVVAAENAARYELFTGAGLSVVRCPDAHRGMGHSLRFGIDELGECDGWLVALADMPFIKPSTLRGVATGVRAGSPIVVPRHRGREGHPVGFAAALGEELRAIDGDRGARAVVIAHAAQVCYFDCEDQGIERDIDVPADLPGNQ